jgi:PBP4 family serine-type D-alanyl-D-alanine carboxypeptidase
MSPKNAIRILALGFLSIALVSCGGSVLAQSGPTLEQRIEKVMDRPEFAHSRFGIEIVSVDTGNIFYELNSPQLFVPGSTTKLLTEGTALELLGGDYRFHTKIYRTGPIQKDGTLQGDLVLVASGDLNLSNRIQPDDTLTFEDADHSYGGPDCKGLPGDPLLAIHELARQVAAEGIGHIAGRVLVDATLFAEGDRKLGTSAGVSPIVVNDNLVDVIVSPGLTENSPVQLKIIPQTAYLTIVNQAKTGKIDSDTSLQYENDKPNSDGTRVVTLTGNLAVGAKPTMVSYPVSEPSSFAATVLIEALKEVGVTGTVAAPRDRIDFKVLARNYTKVNVIAEHISPPLREEVKVTLKVSQNLHANSTPFLLGALVAHNKTESEQAGFDLENEFLTKAGLDLGGASQSNGAGGKAYFSPDFMAHYLLYMSKRKDYDQFYRALPILGRDGTLAKIQIDSAAAGHVHAKTGTYATYDALNKRLMMTGKALAGYMDTKRGRNLVFVLYLNMVPMSLDDPDVMQKVAGEALGQIAAAAYDTL